MIGHFARLLIPCHGWDGEPLIDRDFTVSSARAKSRYHPRRLWSRSKVREETS